jgi:peptide deformylase
LRQQKRSKCYNRAMKLKIVDIKNPLLRRKAKAVKKIDKKVIRLIEDMKETLVVQEDPEGVGLAAPQVGKSMRIFVMHCLEEGLDRKVVINPKAISIKKKISKKTKKKEKLLEGCLSIPHYYGPVGRKNEITIKYTSEDGKELTETFKGFAAHIVQHEIDHLNGVIFIDHILEQKKPLYWIKDDEYEEVEI